MRRSYLRIRRNRTHNGRPYPRDRVRDETSPGPQGGPDREREPASDTPRIDHDFAHRRDRG
jgi:hypothetical protein